MSIPRAMPNYYAGGQLDRGHHLRGNEEWLAERLAHPQTRLVPVWRTRSLVSEGEAPRACILTVAEARAILGEIGATCEPKLLGLAGEVSYFLLDLSHHDEPPPLPGGAFADLRAVGPLMEREEGALLAYARALTIWDERHRFCGVCGHRTIAREAGHVRQCANPSCNAQHFPRTDPAVIMLIHDGGDRLVLSRQAIWPVGMHSVLAGFVEPGESLEDAVAREVWEEVGLPLRDIRYHSSQPWPFPSSIMLGFTARAEHDGLRVNRDELEEARWYRRAELLASPEDETFRLPRRDSIARRLIEDWLSAP